MAKEICISSTPHETRLAILEDDQLAEIYYERENEYTLAGSVYNGRVTRVLPGMQSAFVDIGLERDAFLYVTDFLELEDQEETDELEKAAASNPNQPPREVRQGGDRNGPRAGQKQEQRQDQRPGRERRPAVESAPEAVASLAPPAAPELVISEQGEDTDDGSGEPGAKRWRGRRRRRGGRGSAGAPTGQPAEPEEASETTLEPAPAPEPTVVAHEIQAAGTPPGSGRAPVPFVLPGESLSKYGGSVPEPAEKPAPEAAAPARPASSFRPSSLIEAPLAWDGSGLLPGESLARHRGRQAEAQPEAEPELEGGFSHRTESTGNAADAFEEQSLVEEMEEYAPESPAERAAEFPAHAGEDDLTEETTEIAAEAHAPSEPEVSDPAESGEDEPEANATASHHVDPAPPTGFRLFGLGGKKKKSDAHTEEAVPAPRPTAPVSTFAPGTGLVEEEVIEGEEDDLSGHHHHHKADEHDLDEYEEETLQTQIRSGELGEMLQEAHLDHRIQLDFDEKGGEEEEEEGFEDEEEEPALAEGQPAGEGAAQPRRDRGGRGRRSGRSAPGAQGGQGQGNRRGPSRRSMQTSDLPIISDLLKPGQEILVQIAKEPIAKKGARITSHIALPGRFLVFMPTVSHVGVSRKIASDEERQRLKRILVSERGEATGGFIVRTAAEGATEEELRA
ncbi:MAG TPA: ribonuclease E/G, partial [Candidatus Sulfopaludibacter sp.]|nr:ribonuclease E/G [Candidatus Sulfopaludibacter sp.]